MKPLLSLAGVVLLAFSCHAAERIPGTRVTLTPPPSFTPSADFDGYMNEETGASILVVEIPGPYTECIKGMTADNLKANGIKLVSSEAVKVGEADGMLMLVDQEANDRPYRKWLLVFGEKETVMIHGTAPREEFEKSSDALKSAMLAVVWDPSIEVGILEALPFTMEESGDMKFAFKMASGVALTREGIHPQPELDKPLVVVNVVSDQEFKKDADQQAYAHALLAQTSKLQPEALKISKEMEIPFCGKSGYYVAATGKPENAGSDLHYEISVLVEDGRATTLFGRVSAESAALYTAVFASLRDTIKHLD